MTEVPIEPEELHEGSEVGAFIGHDAQVADSLRYAAPGLAAAHAFGSANATGSAQARRRARIMVMLVFGLPLLLTMLGFALSLF